MNGMSERMDSFERRLDTLSTDVRGLREDVGELRGEVGELRGEVGELRGEVHSLRVVVENHDSQIGLIAEVQAHHGNQLEEHGRLLREIKQDVGPLKDLRDFVARIADEHEQRIKALEGRP